VVTVRLMIPPTVSTCVPSGENMANEANSSGSPKLQISDPDAMSEREREIPSPWMNPRNREQMTRIVVTWPPSEEPLSKNVCLTTHTWWSSQSHQTQQTR